MFQAQCCCSKTDNRKTANITVPVKTGNAEATIVRKGRYFLSRNTNQPSFQFSVQERRDYFSCTGFPFLAAIAIRTNLVGG